MENPSEMRGFPGLHLTLALRTSLGIDLFELGKAAEC